MLPPRYSRGRELNRAHLQECGDFIFGGYPTFIMIETERYAAAACRHIPAEKYPTMKLPIAALLLLSFASTAKAFVQSGSTRSTFSTELSVLANNDAQLDRRSFTSAAGMAFFAATATSAISTPLPAKAVGYFSEYTPNFEDLKQIYVLGVTLDRLGMSSRSSSNTYPIAQMSLL